MRPIKAVITGEGLGLSVLEDGVLRHQLTVMLVDLTQDELRYLVQASDKTTGVIKFLFDDTVEKPVTIADDTIDTDISAPIPPPALSVMVETVLPKEEPKAPPAPKKKEKPTW